MVVIEPNSFRPKTMEKTSTRTTPARDQEMAELVEEHHQGQDERKGIT